MQVIKDRYHGLDLLRSLAMLLGIVFHAPIFFYIPEMADGFRDFGIATDMIPEMELWLQILVQWSHSWRMTAFFIISGFFAHMIFQRRGITYLLRDRFIRLGLTLLLFASLMDMLDGRFDGKLEHFWFIYYLLVISLVTAVAWRITSRNEQQEQSAPSDRWLIILICAFVPVRMACDMLDGGTIRIASSYIDVKIGGLIYFTFCFVIGAALYARRHVLTVLSQRPTLICLGVMAALAFAIYFTYAEGVFGHRRSTNISLTDSLVGSVFASSSALLWSLFLLGLTHALVKRGSALVRWLVELSYPVYLVHLVPTMVISAMLIGKGHGQLVVVLATVMPTFVISVMVYYIFIKFTPLSWLINGHAKSWLKLPNSKQVG